MDVEKGFAKVSNIPSRVPTDAEKGGGIGRKEARNGKSPKQDLRFIENWNFVIGLGI